VLIDAVLISAALLTPGAATAHAGVVATSREGMVLTAA
jgi:hypothetical protein